ncbi:MAG: pyridine nucleotide-disulfide oxidoreductase [Planctomycetes bacterium]|nr:pyridine nucleotide-disulfide oxidoreductase [Planctomycetota bacterium]
MSRHESARATPGTSDLNLGISGWSHADLFDPQALARLHALFCEDLKRRDPVLGLRYSELLRAGAPSREEESWTIAALGPHVGRFLAALFGAEGSCTLLTDLAVALEPVFEVRREFVKRRALKKVAAAEIPADITEVRAVASRVARVCGSPAVGEHEELSFSRAVLALLVLEKEIKVGAELSAAGETVRGALAQEWPAFAASSVVADLDAPLQALLGELMIFCAASVVRPATCHGWVLFEQQHHMDHAALVPHVRSVAELPTCFEGPAGTRRERPGFDLTDTRMNPHEVAAQVDICIFCHHQKRDSCATGLRDKEGKAKKNPLGVELDGCPLEEHISEAHELQQGGHSIAALAAVMINNPMCPGTGHRICNDCMKACIFQKQDPVNIPQIETGILSAVLALPFGAELYALLTRWNPLNLRRPYQLPYNGVKVLVVGLGPAGYTLAHYLSGEGFGIVAIDGLKIEPLPADLVGPEQRAVKDWHSFAQPLDQRVLSGFGGVSEYGITVRWDKNFLRLLHLSLARKRNLAMFGGIRFGGTLTLDDARELGFAHVAIATGAGKPTIVDMKNNLVRGVRQASDFLMALQLTGAAKHSSLANLQVELPGIVVGGGLTAIDTATELMAYYPIQVERVLQRSELLQTEGRLDAYLAALNPEERATWETFMAHGRAVRAEREAAQNEARPPKLSELVRAWGGVSIAYRKSVQDAPAYRLNHEEVVKALEEGVRFIENVSPQEVVSDAGGRIQFLKLTSPAGDIELPCRALMIAAGTSPNTIYEREHPGSFSFDGKFFRAHRIEGSGANAQLVPDKSRDAFFTSYMKDGMSVSYYGDNHPTWNGNVVKAMASARKGYPHVVALFPQEVLQPDVAQQAQRDAAWQRDLASLSQQFQAEVVRVERLTPTIVEVVIKAPMAARRFLPGQFFRLQDFEATAPLHRGLRMSMEGLALTGAWVDRERGLLSLIILEMGGSSSLCELLQPGQPVVCMGPTGTPTTIPKGEKVVLCGGGLGNAVLFSIARALKDNGCSVLYFAGYKNGADLFKRDEVEAGTDQVIWSTDSGDAIAPRRTQDAHFRGNIVESMLRYARGEHGPGVFPLREATRFIVIGSDRMMAAVGAARRDETKLRPFLGTHAAIGSINSPMQCMMKEVCAQCLQRHVDPVTGKESFVFSCFDQDQCLDKVDFVHLNLRLRQNGVLEKLTAGVIALLKNDAVNG